MPYLRLSPRVTDMVESQPTGIIAQKIVSGEKNTLKFHLYWNTASGSHPNLEKHFGAESPSLLDLSCKQ